MPGFDKNDISVELSEGYLTVSAKRDESKESEEKIDYVCELVDRFNRIQNLNYHGTKSNV